MAQPDDTTVADESAGAVVDPPAAAVVAPGPETVQPGDGVDIDPVDLDGSADRADELVDETLVHDVDHRDLDAAADLDDADLDDTDLDDTDAPADPGVTVPAERSLTTTALWSETRVEPVEIALPKGAGYTLRAYRMSNELAAVEVDEREDEFAGYLSSRAGADEDDEVILLEDDDEALATLGVETAPDLRKGGRRDRDDDDDPDAVEDDELLADDVDDDAGDDEPDDAQPGDAEASGTADDPADDDEDDETPEEVPVFLGRRGTIYLFSTPESLVEFVRTSDDHDLAQLDTWSDVREQITVDDIVPTADDRYELDLVVDNLRGGADALDLRLLIRAGEAARDIAYATRLEPVITALASGSPLDDLDEAVRSADRGGIRAFMARRKLRRIVTQQTALGWRTIVGKISAVVDWRN